MVVLPPNHNTQSGYSTCLGEGPTMRIPATERRLSLFFALLAMTFAFADTARPQTTTGRILGSVHDQQEAAITVATVTVTDPLRNNARTAVTDEAGDYVVADLLPSTYSVSIQAKGFNTFQADGIVLE